MSTENSSDNKETKALSQVAVSSRLLLRIATDLQKELVRQTNEAVKQDLEMQIEGLKALHKEVEDYRTIKRLLNGF
jgi:hypothetical protein